MWSSISIHDFITIKNNVFSPDCPNINLSGLTGTVTKIVSTGDKKLALIQLSNSSLDKLPKKYIDYSILKNLDYNYIFLDIEKIEKID